jgi:PAS domain S-box-containing protein
MTTSPRQTESQSRSWVEAVLELLPVAVLLIDPHSGAVTWANSRADRLAGGAFPRGTDRFGTGTSGFQALNAETGEPLRLEESPSHIAAQTGRRVDGVHIDIVTSEGRISVVASAEVIPPIGDMASAVVVSFEDVTELRTAQRTAEDAKALIDTLFASAPIGLGYFDRDLRFVRVNDALAEMNGLPAEEHLGRTIGEVLPDIDQTVITKLQRVVDTGEPVTGYELHGQTPAEPAAQRTWLEGLYPVRGAAGEILGVGVVTVDITERKAAEAERERALVAERAARAAAEAAARRARFLAEASGLLDRSLDYDETLESIAVLAVPDIADWCTVDALEHGELRNVVVRHVDPEKTAFGERLLGTFHYPPDAPNGPPEVVRTGRSELLPEITDEMLVANARNDEHLEMLRELGMRSVMVVPMISRARMLGTITFVSAESSRQFDEDDVLLAEDLGRRAAVAFDNARLYSERAQIARTLQESLLPPQLPTIPGVEVAARYLAAGEGIEVGGDFYDLFEVRPGDWAIVMGDVCGKGADAAALTALARYTLRATARPEAQPSDALQTLNDEVLRQRGDGRFITVAYARLAPGADGGARAVLSIGGHPSPIVLRAGGGAEAVGTPGTLLGVVPDPALANDTIELGPGDTLFLYTDGVTEAYAPEHLLEVEDVARIVAACAGADAADLVKRVEDEVRSLGAGQPGDDIAMLALRLTQNGEAPGA